MKIHKNTRLTPYQRKQLVKDYFDNGVRVCDLARKYQVSRPTVYKIIHRSRKNDYSIHKSTNLRFRCLKYGLKRLEKIEKKLENKLKRKARRYNKKYPGEMIHVDVKRLPLLKKESPTKKHEYLFVAIDDFSRELFAAIMPDKTSISARKFLEQVLDECSYTIEKIYSDNGREFKGNPDKHPFMKLCEQSGLAQGFTKVKHPWTNGKAERVIRTVKEQWHDQIEFKDRDHRKIELNRYINYYNGSKPHKSLNNMTPFEFLVKYFISSVNNP